MRCNPLESESLIKPFTWCRDESVRLSTEEHHRSRHSILLIYIIDSVVKNTQRFLDLQHNRPSAVSSGTTRPAGGLSGAVTSTEGRGCWGVCWPSVVLGGLAGHGYTEWVAGSFLSGIGARRVRRNSNINEERRFEMWKNKKTLIYATLCWEKKCMDACVLKKGKCHCAIILSYICLCIH